jgi:hypothetical protein
LKKKEWDPERMTQDPEIHGVILFRLIDRVIYFEDILELQLQTLKPFLRSAPPSPRAPQLSDSAVNSSGRNFSKGSAMEEQRSFDLFAIPWFYLFGIG